jgi:hypothetical protein
MGYELKAFLESYTTVISRAGAKSANAVIPVKTGIQRFFF